MVSVLRRVPTGVMVVGALWCASVAAPAQETTDETSAASTAEAGDTPAVASPLVVEPQSQTELFEAAVLMVDLARPEVARVYLTKFMEGEITDELLLALREKHGPSVFLKLANLRELQPESTDLLKRNNEAFARFARDPARLDSLLRDLATGTSSQRLVAQDQMKTSGVLVVPVLISGLGQPAYEASQSVLIDTLGLIGKDAIDPLCAALNSSNDRTRQGAMQALGVIRDERAIPCLLRFAGQAEPSDDKVVASRAIARILGTRSITSAQSSGVAPRLMEQARDHLLGRVTYEAVADDQVSIWEWDDSLGTVVERRVSAEEKSRHEAANFARAALDVAPELPAAQTLYLNVLLTREVAQHGQTQPLPTGQGTVYNMAESLGPDVVARAVDEALDLGLRPAAAAGLQILARTGSVQHVRRVGGKTAGIQRALNYPSRRVQFAAVESILSLDPDRPFPGSERVIATLGRSLNQADSPLPRALVLDAVIERGQSLTGFLQQMGYEPTLVRTGRDGFKAASSLEEVDLILVDANVQRWALSETLANFKSDPRTRDLPMVIYGSSVTQRDVRIHLQQYPNVVFIEQPAAADDLRIQLKSFLAMQEEPALTPEERSGKAQRAAEWLSFLSQGQRRTLYNFTTIEPQLLSAVENPLLTELLLPVVGALPTRAAQTRLAEITLDNTLTEPLRAGAARQLIGHIRRHTLTLGTELQDQLRQEWRGSAHPELSVELSALMGVLRPNASTVGDLLRNAPSNAPAAAPAPMTESATE